ncbi:hypothetical protein VdG1_01324 [Verticillium dahliae VDG1]|nr:hypothetical protein VdG1_01324 [Verticillium dahliae VDG1]
MAEPSYNALVEGFRDREYPMLKESVYLDHAGTTVYSKSMMDMFTADMMSNLLGNPHSGSLPSQYTTSRIEDIRLRLLTFFNADPSEFDLVFVANATAGVKLVLEAFRNLPAGFSYAYHQACHTSLVGVREEAVESICIDNDHINKCLAGHTLNLSLVASDSTILFAHTAQSHMDGRRYPVSWSSEMRKAVHPSRALYTMLDASSLVTTSPLDLSDSETSPDFTVLSLYKIFGFPDLGALIVRRQAQPIFNSRRYFGGGTVDTVVCGKEKWHASKSQFLHERLEDGTLPFHSIIALDAALHSHKALFGTMAHVASHTLYLRRHLAKGLSALRHSNGEPVCVLYGEDNDPNAKLIAEHGPVVAFNLLNAAGAWISLNEFEKLATLQKFHVRTGGVCSPGGIAAALKLEPWEVRRNFSAGFRCGTDQDIIAGKPTGVIRASLGAMSIMQDVKSFVDFIAEFYRETEYPATIPPTTTVELVSDTAQLRVQALSVFPIKSCAAYSVPHGIDWEVKPEGLAWDREWCLVHSGTGQALSQKRYPQMALIRPVLDFQQGLLRVTCCGPVRTDGPSEVSVPLSADPTVLDTQDSNPMLVSRVCGDQISAQKCALPEVNAFFSDVLGVPCVLARFPAGGRGRGMRQSKAQIQKHQRFGKSATSLIPGSFPDLPSPPDSDSEQQGSKILLANESPILLVNTASLRALNHDIMAKGDAPVPISAFRGNVVIGPSNDNDAPLPYAEDAWANVKIGHHNFQLMGSCRRCQMVCVDQKNGAKHQEPFLTLAKTRRFDGKVFFGTHMRHDCRPSYATKEAQYPTIRVGDTVEPNAPTH